LLLVWDLVAKTLLYAVRLPTPIAQATQVRPDPTAFVPAAHRTFTKGVQMWLLPATQQLRSVGLVQPAHRRNNNLPAHTRCGRGGSAARQVHFMPDNRTVAVAVDTGSLLFVDVVAARLTARLGDGRLHVCTAFSIDARGNYAALVAEEGAVRLHDLAVLRKNTLATTELARVDTGAISDSLLRTSLPYGPPSAHAVGGEPVGDDEPDALLGA